MERRTIDISWVSLWRIFAFLLFALMFFYSRKILLGLFLAIVISSGLEFIVNFLERRRLPRALSVIFIFLLTALTVIFVVYTIIPLLIVDVNTAFLSISKLGQHAWWGSFFSLQATESFNTFLARISGQLFGNDASPFATFAGILGGFALALSVIVSSFYLSLSRDGVERFIRAVFPKAHEGTVLRVYHRSLHRVGIWFRAQLLLSLVMAALILVTLLVLGVHYAVLLAIVTGILEIVPFIGPMIAGALAVLAAFITSPSLALYTLIACLVLHQIENHILVPLLVGRNVGLHPVIVIIALLIGLEVGGVLGMVISVPAAVVMQEVIEEWAGKRRENNLPPEGDRGGIEVVTVEVR